MTAAMTDERERFIAKIHKTETCWIWTDTPADVGYGIFWTLTRGEMGRRKFYAHRFAYEHFIGPIPEGHEIDHLCRVRLCVNPDHLEAVTKYENNMRSLSNAAENARKTHCIRGHEFTPENTYVRKDRKYPARQCRTCQRIRLGRAA